jgi:hypothetical protein
MPHKSQNTNLKIQIKKTQKTNLKIQKMKTLNSHLMTLELGILELLFGAWNLVLEI